MGEGLGASGWEAQSVNAELESLQAETARLRSQLERTQAELELAKEDADGWLRGVNDRLVGWAKEDRETMLRCAEKLESDQPEPRAVADVLARASRREGDG